MRAALAVALALASLVPAVAYAGGDAGPAYWTSHMTLTGKAETPKGDPNGSGTVTLCIEQKSRTVTYRFGPLRRIGSPTAGHIHLGAKGTAGVVVLPFAPPGRTWKGSASVTSGLLTAMLQHPRRYYVNVHTKAYPAGAIRAQLVPWKQLTGKKAPATCGF